MIVKAGSSRKESRGQFPLSLERGSGDSQEEKEKKKRGEQKRGKRETQVVRCEDKT